MAIYHFRGQIIGRKEGRSSTAAAAYRSGEKIVDERTGEVFDFTRKQSVDRTVILAPDESPDWVYDRSRLWNEVEKAEKRGDAQLAREFDAAIPVELVGIAEDMVVLEFVNEQFVELGMVADIAFHDLDSHNPHVHIMLTMRTITEDGFGKKNRDWNDKKLLKKWREEWAKKCNEYLKTVNAAPIDHRSLQAQGVTDRLPGRHMGPAATAMERRGEISERGEEIRAEQEAFEVAVITEQVWENWENDQQLLQDEVELLEVDSAIQNYHDMIESEQIHKEIIEEDEQREAQRRKRAEEKEEEEKQKAAYLILIAPTPTAFLSTLAPPDLFAGFSTRTLCRKRDGEKYQKIEKRNNEGKVVESVAVFEKEIRLYEHEQENMKVSVARMLALAIQQGWDLNKIGLQGSGEFVREAQRQIAEMQRQISAFDTAIPYQAEKVIHPDRKSVESALQSAAKAAEQTWSSESIDQEQKDEYDYGNNKYLDI